MANFIIAWDSSINVIDIAEHIKTNILPQGTYQIKTYSQMLLIKNMPSYMTEEYLIHEINKIYLENKDYIDNLCIYVKEIKSTLSTFPCAADDNSDNEDSASC